MEVENYSILLSEIVHRVILLLRIFDQEKGACLLRNDLLRSLNILAQIMICYLFI